MLIDEGVRFAWNEQTQGPEESEEEYTWVITDGSTAGTITFTTEMHCYDGVLIGYSLFCAYYDEHPHFNLMFGPIAIDVEHDVTYS